MNIPFADLKRQYELIKPEITEVINTLFNDFQFIGSLKNSHVRNFEHEFSEFLGIKNVIGCANGTDAIEIALKAIDLQPGDEVIVPAISWFSTSEAVSMMGGKPVFVDVNYTDCLIDVAKIEEKITSKTKAIIPVHLYGQACAMDKIMEIAAQHNLKVIEDCAQAHGAKFKNKIAGTFGDISTFSFYPGKNLGAYGDAGAMITDNDAFAEMCQLISHHGSLVKHQHQIEGRNSRLDGLHAATLSVKLRHLGKWTDRRRAIAKMYAQSISNENISLLKSNPDSYNVYHLYVIKSKHRDQLKEFLKSKGIGSAIHYPKPLPFLKPYAHHNLNKEDYQVCDQLKDEILSIPMFPELQNDEIEYVIECLNSFKP